MIKTVLVVCVGNICRSPLGERLLQAMAPHLLVSSAGIGALVGKAADLTASEVAAAHEYFDSGRHTGKIIVTP